MYAAHTYFIHVFFTKTETEIAIEDRHSTFSPNRVVTLFRGNENIKKDTTILRTGYHSETYPSNNTAQISFPFGTLQF